MDPIHLPHPAPATRFADGVGSGDPTTSSVVLWTRVEEAPARLRWQVAPAPTGTGSTTGWPDDAVVASGEITADPGEDGTARVVVGGLVPGRSWLYRFLAPDGAASPIGRTATLPVDPPALTLGLACCADWSNGPFDGYRWLSDRELDVVVHLGDYLYEYGSQGPFRAHDPAHPCLTVQDYRRRYRQYRSDPALRALHQGAPWFTLWDDHEFADDARPSGSAGHDRRRHGVPWDERRRAAVRANREWLPRGPDAEGTTGLDRHRRFGELLDLVLLDTRMGGREQSPSGSGGPATAPATGGRLLSDQQWEWLGDVVRAPAPRWTVVVSSVQVSPLRLTAVPGRRGLRPTLRPVVNPDQWDGYPAERERLLALLRPRAGSVLLVSGDLHGRFLTAARTPYGAVPEVTIPSISAAPFADLVRRSVPFVPTRALEWWLRLLNPHVDDLDLASHGAATLRVEDERVTLTTGPTGSVERVVLGAAGPVEGRRAALGRRRRRRQSPPSSGST